jgi:hypothetical protein
MPASDNDAPVPFGVWAETGVFEPSIDQTSLAEKLRKEGPEGALSRFVLSAKASADFGVVGGDDVARDLHQSGWAVLYGPSVSDDIKQALQPLLEHRESLTGGQPLFCIYQDYVAGQSAEAWLKAAPRSATMQVVDPEQNNVPYYILIVASPDDIPFEFQFELDLFWAVGRLWFSTPDEFACYARSVVSYETADTVATRRELALFGTLREQDQASAVLSANVFTPWTQSRLGQRQQFAQRLLLGADATKKRLTELFTGDGGTPALLFTGSHGALFSPASPWLTEKMGALVCQDWPGSIPVNGPHIFAASDVPRDAHVHGMIHVMFCCYGGGWPAVSSYKRDQQGNPIPVSPQPMIARLPQALLGRENGALAVVAHVDAAYGYSYTANNTPQSQSLKDVLVRLMLGQPVGHATDQLNVRWAGVTARLLQGIESLKWSEDEDSAAMVAKLWVARNDARNYVVLGDPAVRLRVNDIVPAHPAI